jgi:L-ascorbate metabolism protein UlaG (beta-lactamase superfamily)
MSNRVANRRAILSGALGVGAAPFVAGPSSANPSPRPRSSRARQGGTMSWLGNAGWRMEAAGHPLLIDPYLTRFSTGLATGSFDPSSPLQVDQEAIRSVVPSARTILVTHTHWDHFNDVPHLAVRDKAKVFGTLSAYHLAASFGVPAGQLCPVKGGEELDLGEFVVRVVPSLHSRTASGSLLFPGTLVTTPENPPTTISGLPEGDTVSYVVSQPGGPRVFIMGASDFIDHELRDLEPDVAALVVPSTGVTHEYLPRLLEGLGGRLRVPVDEPASGHPCGTGPAGRVRQGRQEHRASNARSHPRLPRAAALALRSAGARCKTCVRRTAYPQTRSSADSGP